MTTLTMEHGLMVASVLFALGLFGLLTLAGCDADFDPGSNVSSFRVLTVQADNPYASPGETVHLSATYYDPDARDITWAWLQCSNPASSSRSRSGSSRSVSIPKTERKCFVVT